MLALEETTKAAEAASAAKNKLTNNGSPDSGANSSKLPGGKKSGKNGKGAIKKGKAGTSTKKQSNGNGVKSNTGDNDADEDEKEGSSTNSLVVNTSASSSGTSTYTSLHRELSHLKSQLSYIWSTREMGRFIYLQSTQWSTLQNIAKAFHSIDVKKVSI